VLPVNWIAFYTEYFHSSKLTGARIANAQSRGFALFLRNTKLGQMMLSKLEAGRRIKKT
jgi:hypothetical protein